MAIATYVFLDLQSNCAPVLNREVDITELCLLAIKHSHLVKKRKKQEDLRIQHKLQMCFNPKSSLDQSASETGLTEDLLKNEAIFDKKVCELIKAFIEGLEKPVCLVAHNGFQFHYPLLVQHLKKFDVELDKSMVCTDSLYAFLEILESEKTGTTKYVKVKVGKKPKKGAISKNKQHYIHIMTGIEKNLIKMRTEINNYTNLSDIYVKVLQQSDLKELDSNTAENHCIMLMKLMQAKKQQFLIWIENNYSLFSEMPDNFK